ncbi:TIGR03545 family protein [bacterium]|nr:TIGR03545 family protein [bacterium]
MAEPDHIPEALAQFPDETTVSSDNASLAPDATTRDASPVEEKHAAGATPSGAYVPATEPPQLSTLDPQLSSETFDETFAETTKAKLPSGLGPRWSYLVTRGIVVAVVWAFFAFLFDPLLRTGAITAGQQAAQAKVDIGGLSTKLFPPRVQLDAVAIANGKRPGTNLIQFETLEGDIDGLALLHGSYVIDQATVTGLTWGTERADSGLLDQVEPPEEHNGEGVDFEKLGRDWAQGIFERAKLEYDPRNLESVQLADQLEDEWKGDFNDLESRAKQIDTEYRELEDLIKLAKGGNPLKKLETYRRVADESRRLLQNVELVRRDLQQLPPKAKGDLGSLNEARQRDQEEIKRKVNELIVDPDKLSEFLLGPELHHKVSTALAWVKWANRTANHFKSDPKPERQRGEDIRFHRDEELPKYLARLINVAGNGRVGNDDLWIEGSIADVSSDPVLYGRPTVIRMNGRGEAAVQMKGVLDRTTKTAKNEVDLTYDLNSATTQRLGDNNSLAIDVQAETTRWTVHLTTTGEELSGKVLLVQQPVQLTPHVKEGVDEAIVRIIGASVQSIDRVEATVALSGTLDRPKLKLSTNLGPAIANGVKRGLGNEVTAQKDALIAQLNERLDGRNKELIGLFNDRYKSLFSQLDGKQDLIRKLVPNVADAGGFDPTKLFR